MKKIVLFFAAAAAALLSASAQETVKTLYSGEPKEVTWESTLSIPADEFAEGVEVGNYIYITFSETTDVIEIKANGTWLPGSRFTSLGDNSTDFKAYITKDMLAALKAYGLEICGAKFTVTGVSVCNDGFRMPDGAIWGGYFWVDSWSTLEIFKTAFDNYAGQRYMDIYLSDDLDNYTGYFLKVLTKWNPETVWANNDQITHAATVATVDLSGINVKESLADVNAVMIQGNKEGGNPFNIVAVALRHDPSGVADIDGASPLADVTVYNLQGMPVMTNTTVAEAQAVLPAGIYIANGIKFVVK